MRRKGIQSALGRFLAFGTILLAALAARPATGDYDGRLPIGKGQPLSRFGDSPPLYSTLFTDVNGAEAAVYWDPLLNTPRYISMRSGLFLIEYSRIDDENLIEACRSFIDRNCDFFGVGSQDLVDPAVSKVDDSWLIVFDEAASGVPIRGANIRILLTSFGAIESVKAFLLRDPPSRDYAFAPFDPIENLLDGWKVKIESFERQIYFPLYDPASLSPVWYVRGVDAESQPWEYFFDPASGELREQRRIVFELGEITGSVNGVYPDPENIYAAASELKVNANNEYITHPVAGARIKEKEGTRLDPVTSDENGNFVIQFPGDPESAVVLECKIEYGRNDDELPKPSKTDSWEKGYNVLLDVRVEDSNCNPNDWYSLPLTSESLALKAGSDYPFKFEKTGDVTRLANSAALMAFHHIRNFMNDTFDRLKKYDIRFQRFFPLTLVVPQTSKLRREYLPCQTCAHICFSAVLKADDGYSEHDQLMTPTLIQHEYAHHLIYILTRAQESEFFDCKKPDDIFSCIEHAKDPIDVREGLVIEGIADALAAYQAGIPKFGYYEPDVRGWMGYDISDLGKNDHPRDRAEVAKALWDLYKKFKEYSSLNGDQIAINLIYRWLGRNDPNKPTHRIFDGSQVLMEEILDALDADHFTEESDNDRNTVSKYDGWVLEAFSGRKFFYGMFIRGDADQNLTLDISDPIFILTYLFVGGVEGRCLEAMDVDADNSITITDPIYFLNYVFLGGEKPPLPYPNCGVEPEFRDDPFSCWYPVCEVDH